MANERARYLRKTMSGPEILLWSQLRGKQLDGHRFRRQHPIGPYIADFVCLEQRLIIEVDGGQHGEPEQIEHDAQRTDWLQHEGYRVLRVWSAEVFENTNEVLDRIVPALNWRV